ncbi:hypothetical protein GCM10007049_10380 [Echinicola pacifica]|uniref:O-Antigen ligase n=1 Tax=Echinicola pacifica TaxID=346377 RepID=A0A918PQS8_9BACT|nr:hypothetical protein [Echinicola pacifica]GGZ19764.1 hypothetical protein GCM10007049_10380 [Echinicola pacifica]
MLFIIIIIYVLAITSISLDKIIFKGKWEWVIFFMIMYLPIYITVLSVVYQATGSAFMVSIFQYLKEMMLFAALGSFLVYQRNIFAYPIKLHLVDKLFLAFYALALIFLILPIGPATFIDKLKYFKNISIPGIMYFIGRNTRLSDREFRQFFITVMIIFFLAVCLNIFEKSIGVHFQNIAGYALYNKAINEVDPVGNYGLTWTFETQTTEMRLASFFSDPLELASSCLMGFSVGLIGYLTSKRNQSWVFILTMLCTVGSVIFAASRASFASFFIMLCFIAIIFRLYGLLKMGIFLFLFFVIYVVWIANDEFYYFVIDTLTFENASSFGHVVAWLEAINEMSVAPLGSGLATSGNASAVSDDLRIGGENQFLIFGVQMGILGMLLYISILYVGIKTAIHVFRTVDDINYARIGFIAATTKVGLLLPLFTANAELYAFVSWTSWWMIGLSIRSLNSTFKPTLVPEG